MNHTLLNTGSLRKGRRSSGRSVCVVLVLGLAIILAGCSDLFVHPASDTTNIADFEQAWKITNSVYPYFQFKRVNWDSIHTVYQPLAEHSNGDEIFKVLYDMLAELKDGHVSIKTLGGSSVRTYVPPRTDKDRFAFDPLVVRKYFRDELKLAGGNRIEYGTLPQNIGYVRIATFLNGTWIYDYDAVLQEFQGTRGLIIDVRGNGGGSDMMGDVVVSRLLTVPLGRPTNYYRGQPYKGSPLQPWGPVRYVNPVVVLMNGTCFSATEDFLNTMGEVPGVVLVGDTSAGGSGAPQDFALPSGRGIHISTIDFRRYDNQPIEWNGIIPDVLVVQTQADLQRGHDLQLERAIALLQ